MIAAVCLRLFAFVLSVLLVFYAFCAGLGALCCSYFPYLLFGTRFTFDLMLVIDLFWVDYLCLIA